MRRLRTHLVSPFLLGWLVCVGLIGGAIASDAAEDDTSAAVPIRKPLGPDELPEALPGRWKVSLCVLESKHAWIRFENVETGEVRTISRFNLLVGGYRDKEHGGWHYPPTFRAGVYMDREQGTERRHRQDEFLLLSTYVDDPQIFKGPRDGRGHGSVVNNCATYTRDAWHFYTGDHYWLDRFHNPEDLRAAVLRTHPELKSAAKPTDELAPPAAKDESPAVRGAEKRRGFWRLPR